VSGSGELVCVLAVVSPSQQSLVALHQPLLSDLVTDMPEFSCQSIYPEGKHLHFRLIVVVCGHHSSQKYDRNYQISKAI